MSDENETKPTTETAAADTVVQPGRSATFGGAALSNADNPSPAERFGDFVKDVVAATVPGAARQPSPGRVVHYVMPSGRGKGQHRPATVVSASGDICNLSVMLDGPNDGVTPTPLHGDAHAGLYLQHLGWAPSVRLDPSGAPGTWHWPEGT